MPAATKWRKTKTPGVQIRHQVRCPAAESDLPRCRCIPSYRGMRWDSVRRTGVFGPSTKDRNEVLTWLGEGRKHRTAVAARAAAGPTLRELAEQWLDGARTGAIARRRGKKDRRYSDTTLEGYDRSLRLTILPEFGARPASEIDEREWQAWADRLARQRLSRSRIANHVAVLSAVYGWAARPSRALLPRNPILTVELPPNDEQPRTRVAPMEEAEQLLAALEPADALPYAIAFFAGYRRAEIRRLDWRVMDLEGTRLVVERAKSDAGTMRRPPIAKPLRAILKRAWLAQGRPTEGPVVKVSVMSFRLAQRAETAWAACDPPLDRITLHECRHTYASFLMAAGYTLKELMEYMGHADLQMVTRYVKLLPQPDEHDPAERLNNFLDRRGRVR